MLVGASAFGIQEEWAGGAYLSPPFLCLPCFSTLGISYTSSWVFSLVYAIFWALVMLVGLIDAGDMAVAVEGVMGGVLTSAIELSAVGKGD